MRHFLLIFLSVIFITTSSEAQSTQSSVNRRIVEAILKGKAKELRSMLDVSSKYQRNSTLILNSPLQIIFKLRDFFDLYPCASVRIVSQGGWDDFAYAKLDYRTSTQQDFTFFFFFDDGIISKIQIDGK